MTVNKLSSHVKINMGLFDFGQKKEKIIKALATQVKSLQSRNLDQIAANINRNIAIYPSYDIGANAERYATIDDVYSIIRMLATTSALIPIYAYEVVNDDAQKKLNKIKQPHNRMYEAKALMIKALQDLPDTDRVEQLMENPSEFQSKFEFYESVYTNLFYAGNAILLKERPSLGKNAGLPVALHSLYPQNIVLKVTDTLPRKIVGYDYVVNGQKIYENLPPEDVIHIKYYNPLLTHAGGELWGLSPLDVLSKRLARLDSNMNTSVAQLQNGGVETIVFDKALGSDQDAIDVIGKRKDNFYRFLKNPANAGSPYFASGEMGAIQLGLSLANLSVLELANVDFKKLCNAFGTSDILFNSDAASTESNVNVMEKRMYTNTVLPNVYRVRDALKMGLLSEFEKGRSFSQVNEAGELEQVTIKGDGKKRDLQADISEVPSLQEDMLKMAQWMNISPQITYNERRLMMKFDKLDNPIFDEPFLPSGIQTAEDLVMVDPLQQVTPNGN